MEAPHLGAELLLVFVLPTLAAHMTALPEAFGQVQCHIVPFCSTTEAEPVMQRLDVGLDALTEPLAVPHPYCPPPLPHLELYEAEQATPTLLFESFTQVQLKTGVALGSGEAWLLLPQRPELGASQADVPFAEPQLTLYALQESTFVLP